MKTFLTILTWLVAVWQVNAQGIADILPKEQFMESCKQGASMNPNINAKQFCECAYNGMSKLSMEDLMSLATGFSTDMSAEDAGQKLMSNPKIMQIMMQCFTGGGESTPVVAAEEVAVNTKEMQKTFMKECQTQLKQNKDAKDIKGKTYCACVWDKIMSSEDGLELMVRMAENDPAAREQIERFATFCLIGQ